MRRVIVFLLLAIINLGCSGPASLKPEGGQSTSPGIHRGLYVSAWVANYQQERGLKSFKSNIDLFDEINPVWYNLNPEYFSASAAPFIIYSKNKAELTAAARASGIRLMPTIQNFGISNFDPAVISRILREAEYRERHLTEIVNLVLDEGYDGIDLDYENLYGSDRALFTGFVRELSKRLHHHEKLLSVTVYAKTAEVSWNGAGAQDWPELADWVDSFKVMVYDYHWLTFHPGPIAPVDWLRDVIRYSRTIPGLAGKVIIGLPFYGLDWGTGASAREVMYQDVVSILNLNPGILVARSEVRHEGDPICSRYYANVEPYFEYWSQGNRRTVFYQDGESLRQRLAVINEYRDWLKGITFWRLGGEDPQSWVEVRKYAE